MLKVNVSKKGNATFVVSIGYSLFVGMSGQSKILDILSEFGYDIFWGVFFTREEYCQIIAISERLVIEESTGKIRFLKLPHKVPPCHQPIYHPYDIG